jgi:hypothetical protein
MTHYAIINSNANGDCFDEAKVEISQESNGWSVSITGVRDYRNRKPDQLGNSGIKNIFSSLEEAKLSIEKLYGKLEWFEKR